MWRVAQIGRLQTTDSDRSRRQAIRGVVSSLLSQICVNVKLETYVGLQRHRGTVPRQAQQRALLACFGVSVALHALLLFALPGLQSVRIQTDLRS